MVGSTSAPSSGATPLKKLLMMVMAAVLCLGLAPVAPASAVEPAAEKQTVTLTVIGGTTTDYDTNVTTFNTWVNKEFAFTEGATVEDLLNAAEKQTVTLTVIGGTTTDYDTNVTTFNTWVNKEFAFTEGATVEDLLNAAVESGDLKAYTAPESQYGGRYVGSITSAKDVDLENWSNDDFSASLYWAYYENGSYGQGDCAIDHRKLEAGTKYQLVWASMTTAVAPTSWDDYYKENPVADVADDTVTLTLTAGTKTDYSTNVTSTVTWLNKAYKTADVLAVAQEKTPTATADALTLEDLLNAAVKAGDIKAYTAPASFRDPTGNYIESITSKAGVNLKNWNNDDFSFSLYWSSYQDGEYGQGACGINQLLLKDHDAFQFAWDSYTSANAPADAAAWAAYYRDNPPAAAGADPVLPGGEEPVLPPASEHPATGVSQKAVGSLMTGIAAAYAGTTDPWAVMDLAALGRADEADLDAFYAEALAQAKDPGFDPTALQRSIIALTAAGYDARVLADTPAARAADGFDAIASLGQRISGATVPNARLAALWAYASGDYAVPADARLSKDALIASVLADQQPGGGFALSGTAANADMTAMAISALAPYRDDPSVQNAINRALTALKGIQLPTGGFTDNDGLPNACSTAFAVIALCSAGIDPATEWATESGATPLSALLAYGLQDGSGFAFEADGDRDENATEQGFRALIAYRGLKTAAEDGAYNLYAQARDGGVTIPADEPEPQPVTPPAQEEPGDGDAAKAPAAGTALAPTGDDGLGAAGAVAALALGAACMAVARRREAA